MLLALLHVCIILRHSRKIKRPGLSSTSYFEKCILIIQESHRSYNPISQYVVHTGMCTFAYLAFKCYFCWKLNTKKTPNWENQTKIKLHLEMTSNLEGSISTLSNNNIVRKSEWNYFTVRKYFKKCSHTFKAIKVWEGSGFTVSV